MTVTLKTLGIAFRKAKVDLYYSTNRSLFAIADYEENLQENLQLLQKKINSRSTIWVKDPDSTKLMKSLLLSFGSWLSAA